MGGVNTNRSYVTTMDFGHWNEQTGLVVIDKALKQGGIVNCPFISLSRQVLTTTSLLCTIYLAHSSALS